LDGCFNFFNNSDYFAFYYIHFEITGYPCNLIGSQQQPFFSANENETVKQNNQLRFQGFLKLTKHIAGK